jgi:hypothetical protein
MWEDCFQFDSNKFNRRFSGTPISFRMELTLKLEALLPHDEELETLKDSLKVFSKKV